MSEGCQLNVAAELLARYVTKAFELLPATKFITTSNGCVASIVGLAILPLPVAAKAILAPVIVAPFAVVHVRGTGGAATVNA
jgi:hypothetical protein